MSKVVRIPDARRRLVPLVRVRTLRERFERSAGSRSSADARRRALVRRVARYLYTHGSRAHPGYVAAAVGASLVLVVSILAAFAFLGVVGPCGLTLLVVAVPTGMRSVLRASSGERHWRAISSSFVAEGLCASCGYTLEGLRSERDDTDADRGGVSVCPECGAAWDRSRIVEPVWERRGDAPDPASSALDSAQPRRRRSALATDDAGRIVPLLDSRFRHAREARRSELGEERVMHLTALVRGRSRWGRLLLASTATAAPVVLALLTVPITVRHLQNAGSVDPLDATLAGGLLVLLAAGGIAAGWAAVRSDLFVAPEHVIDPCRSRRRCACCLADLAAPAEGAALATCPSCTARWRWAGPSAHA